MVESRIPLVAFDRNPLRKNAMAAEEMDADKVPWDYIRTSRFGADVDAEKRVRYSAEVLLWGTVPLNLLVGFATAKPQYAGSMIKQMLQLAHCELSLVTRPAFFFD